MKTVAFHTLGCKVNQYDTQAMMEAFECSGYTLREFHEPSDVYVINTCTVTDTGDKKSMQAVRRAQHKNPSAEVVVAGCLAQRYGEDLLKAGVRLVIGTSRRAEIVTLLEKAVAEGKQIAAVGDVLHAPFEKLMISRQEGHTRAVLKVQEGCDRYCSYCIIPYVRGNVRSREISDIAKEALRLSKAGFREIVLTGIHLTSYGRDLNGENLLSAIHAVHNAENVRRIRLGSLEPVVITREFVDELKRLPKVCPQFHLALQSGSDSVLRRMRRRYTGEEFLASVRLLKASYLESAVTTDVLVGFPGETEEDFSETVTLCRKAGFARMHVFPYSRREGTLAADMPGQLPKLIKEERTHILIKLGSEMADSYRASLLGSIQEVLFEERADGMARGYTPQYMQAEAAGGVPGTIRPVHLTALVSCGYRGEIVPVI